MTRLLYVALVLGACVSSDEIKRKQYDADYQTALQLCGHPDLAFQHGYNAGYGGQQMYGNWTALCVPQAQQPALAAYQDGFMKGANNAPIRVVHTVRGIPAAPRPATASAAQCTFDSDCGGEGYHCRSGECMGYGYVGDRCVFNEDCTTDHCFGGTCRED